MRTCFIILPITTPEGYSPKHFEKVLDEICVPAVKMIGLKPIRPDEDGTHRIDEKILAQLHKADLVLCDISSLNANVLYELGIRSALKKPFAIIKDRKTTNPFDLANFRYCWYEAETLYKTKKAKAELIKRVAQHLRRTLKIQTPSAAELIKGAAASGIAEVFASREEVEQEVLSAVQNAKRRLWILGIGLSQVFNLPDNLRGIERKIRLAPKSGPSFDVRILLLDALTSTGVFRTLLESSADRADEILNTPRYSGDERLGDPYLNEQLYQDFENAWKRFAGRIGIENIVRFYGHTPTCWLVTADDTTYFQPYTFGAAPDFGDEGGPIGPLMPVFKFEGAANARPFKILEDHFQKLWLTTNTDLFHVRAAHPEVQDIVQDIFHRHGNWLRHVRGVLHKPGRERRCYPRKTCRSKLDIYVRKASQPPVKVEKVINFSREGLALKLKNIKLKKGERIKVEVITPRQPEGAGKRERAGEYVKRVLVDPYDGKFRVVHPRKDGESFIVGLQPVKKKLTHGNGSRR